MPLFGSLARLDIGLNDILREQNALEEAHQQMSGAIEGVQSWSMPTDRLTFYLILMRVQEAQVDLTGAYETLRLAKELKAAHPVFPNLARMVDLYEIRLAWGLPVFAIFAWVKGWWTISTRVYYTLVILAIYALIWWANY